MRLQELDTVWRLQGSALYPQLWQHHERRDVWMLVRWGTRKRKVGPNKLEPGRITFYRCDDTPAKSPERDIFDFAWDAIEASRSRLCEPYPPRTFIREESHFNRPSDRFSDSPCTRRRAGFFDAHGVSREARRLRHGDDIHGRGYSDASTPAKRLRDLWSAWLGCAAKLSNQGWCMEQYRTTYRYSYEEDSFPPDTFTADDLNMSDEQALEGEGVVRHSQKIIECCPFTDILSPITGVMEALKR